MRFSNIIEYIYGDPVKIRVYKTLAKAPQGFTGRELGTLVHTSPFKINHVLRELVRHGVLSQTIVGKAHLYRLNAQHIIVSALILANLRFEEDILPALGTTLLRRLTPKPLSIIIYGSVARGAEDPSSDLDVALIYPDDSPPDPLATQRGACTLWITQTYGHPGMLRHFKVSDFQHRGAARDPFVRNIVKEGKSIAGLTIIEVLDYGRKEDQHSNRIKK